MGSETIACALRAAGAAVLAVCGTSCVNGDYNKLRVFQPPGEAAVNSLAEGTSSVGDALTQLGAPIYVVEVGLGLALAWGWQDTTNWNVEVSGPVGDAQGQVSFTNTDITTRGLVLFFDQDWTLTRLRRGYLSELLPRRPRPRDVDDELQP